jgi:hypothetical protein
VNPLGQFVYLQGLDVLTTLACLGNGVKEGNPVVGLALAVAPSPLGGLLGIKILAVALAVYCWQRGRTRVLARVNVFFAAVVAWNLVALILRSPAFM